MNLLAQIKAGTPPTEAELQKYLAHQLKLNRLSSLAMLAVTLLAFFGAYYGWRTSATDALWLKAGCLFVAGLSGFFFVGYAFTHFTHARSIREDHAPIPQELCEFMLAWSQYAEAGPAYREGVIAQGRPFTLLEYKAAQQYQVTCQQEQAAAQRQVQLDAICRELYGVRAG